MLQICNTVQYYTNQHCRSAVNWCNMQCECLQQHLQSGWHCPSSLFRLTLIWTAPTGSPRLDFSPTQVLKPCSGNESSPSGPLSDSNLLWQCRHQHKQHLTDHFCQQRWLTDLIRCMCRAYGFGKQRNATLIKAGLSVFAVGCVGHLRKAVVNKSRCKIQQMLCLLSD